MTLSTTRKFKGYENFTLKIDAVTGQKQPKITGWQNQKGAKLVTMESAAVTKAVLTGKVGGVTVIDFGLPAAPRRNSGGTVSPPTSCLQWTTPFSSTRLESRPRKATIATLSMTHGSRLALT